MDDKYLNIQSAYCRANYDRLDIINEIKRLNKQRNKLKKNEKKYRKLYKRINTSLIYKVQNKITEISKAVRSLLKSNTDVNDSKNNAAKQKITAGRKKYLENTNYAFSADEIVEIAEGLSASNGSRYYSRADISIGIISDEFIYKEYNDAANFIYISPSDELSKVQQLDFLLIVSLWHGLEDDWKGVEKEGSPQREILYKIIDECKRVKCPVLFYTIEDPPSYSNYLEIAKKSDAILTSAIEKIDDYKADCNNENVGYLCFTINPMIHNPINMKKIKFEERVIFAGTYYNWFKIRNERMFNIFNGVTDTGFRLDIMDRQYYWHDNSYIFPKRYWQFVHPPIPWTQLQDVHKLYDWAVNLNSVTESNTMFAMRAFELLALGNNVVSNYSLGLSEILPSVIINHGRDGLIDILHGFDENHLFDYQLFGIRSVMTGHTIYDRMKDICSSVGVDYVVSDRSVAVVVKNINDKIQDMFNQQTYENRYLVSFSEFTEEIIKSYDMVTFWDSGMSYGIFYLEDMVNGFKYTDVDFITKDSYYDGMEHVDGIEHDYINKIKSIYRTIFWAESVNANLLKTIAEKPESEHDLTGYSVDSLCYNINPVPLVKDFSNTELSVVIPVYNDGKHLYAKAFSSLVRSTVFNKMEIIIVDNGSTDPYTKKIIKHIDSLHGNVKVFQFDDCVHNSISRSIAKGIDLSTGEHICFLDPKSEIIMNGLSHLHHEIKDTDYDVILSNYIRLSEKEEKVSYYADVLENYGSDVVVDDSAEFLRNTKFINSNIQAMIIKKGIIKKNDMMCISDTFEQTTEFFNALIMDSSRIKVINRYNCTVFVESMENNEL